MNLGEEQQLIIEFVDDLEGELIRRLNDYKSWDPNDVVEKLKAIASECSMLFHPNAYNPVIASPRWAAGERVMVMLNQAIHKWETGKINDDKLFVKSRKTYKSERILIFVTINIIGEKKVINFDYSGETFALEKITKANKKLLKMRRNRNWRFHDTLNISSPAQTENCSSKKRKRSELSSPSPPRRRTRSSTPVPSNTELPNTSTANKRKSLVSKKYHRLPQGQFSSSQDSSSQERSQMPEKFTRPKLKSPARPVPRIEEFTPLTKSAKSKKAVKPSKSDQLDSQPQNRPSRKTRLTQPTAPNENKITKKRNNSPTKKRQKPTQPTQPTQPTAPQNDYDQSRSQRHDDDDEAALGCDGEDSETDVYYLKLNDDNQIVIKSNNSNMNIEIKMIKPNEITDECYKKKAALPSRDAPLSAFVGNDYTQHNVVQRIVRNPDNFRLIRLDKSYRDKSKIKTLENLFKELEANNEVAKYDTTLMLLLVKFSGKWVPSGICICVCDLHINVFRTWKNNRNFKTSNNVFDLEFFKSHLKDHKAVFEKSRSAQQRLQNQINIVQAETKCSYRFFKHPAVVELFRACAELVNKESDTTFMEMYNQMTNRMALSRNARKMHHSILDVSNYLQFK